MSATMAHLEWYREQAAECLRQADQIDGMTPKLTYIALLRSLAKTG